METKVFNSFAIPIIFILLLSACSTAPASNTPIPPTSTSTITPSPEPTSTPTNTPLPPTPTLVPETAVINGVTLNNFGPKLYTDYTHIVIDQFIIPAGLNYVALSPTCWSDGMNDMTIVCPNLPIEEGEGAAPPPVTDYELTSAIEYLHSVGLRVILKPHALIKTKIISHTEGNEDRHWNDAQWEIWFDNYIVFITRYAQLAADNNVDLFVIGNELEETTHREADWRRVIAAVREVYHGPITYAANAWQFEASHIKFWDALDYIGTNAYNYFFSSFNGSTIEDMKEAYRPYLQRLEEMSFEYGKQVLFTEFGAVSKDGYNTGAMRDWMASSYDGQEQADHYTAFFEAIKDKPWVKGIILWDVYTSPLQGGLNDISYTFIAKPAEQVVHQYFGGLPITPTPVPDFVEKPADSMWIYQDELLNSWNPWDEPDAKKLPDFNFPNGHDSASSIRVSLSGSKGLFLNFGKPFIDLSKYKWLEFYVMVGKHEPQTLLVSFEDWEQGVNLGSRLALVNNPRYIEGGKYLSGTWQRVRIPLIDLGYTNQKSNGFALDILGCSWPCQIDPNTDDIYIDDMRLVAGK